MADDDRHLETDELKARQRRFTADVAHELRTPLTGISATASVLAELLEEMSEEAQRAARLLIGDVGRLELLVADLLELAELDSGTDRAAPELIDVRDVVEAVCGTADPSGRTMFQIDVPQGIEVTAEPLRLRRILANLVDNAVVHGGCCTVVRASRDGDDILVEVLDDGRGVAPAERPMVFDRFYKSNASRSDGGTGLGLSIARQHAAALGGGLWMDDGDGPGAHFVLRLPLTDGNQAPT